VTVAIVSDRRMRVLNRTFRGKDYVTDVLSFPVGRAEPPKEGRAPVAISIGDIVIANGAATRQARDHGHAVGTELRLLALHGLLHLLGYDHETDDGRMARAEARLRTKGGLPAGLIARASPRRRS
jgi:probable rRNA maturation factor